MARRYRSSYSSGGDVWPLVALIVVLLLIVFAGSFVCASLPDEGRAERLLDKQGFSDVQYLGRDPFASLQGCSEQDVAVLHFRATNPAGRTVDIDVCQGWPFKGATIRE